MLIFVIAKKIWIKLIESQKGLEVHSVQNHTPIHNICELSLIIKLITEKAFDQKSLVIKRVHVRLVRVMKIRYMNAINHIKTSKSNENNTHAVLGQGGVIGHRCTYLEVQHLR